MRFIDKSIDVSTKGPPMVVDDDVASREQPASNIERKDIRRKRNNGVEEKDSVRDERRHSLWHYSNLLDDGVLILSHQLRIDGEFRVRMP